MPRKIGVISVFKMGLVVFALIFSSVLIFQFGFVWSGTLRRHRNLTDEKTFMSRKIVFLKKHQQYSTVIVKKIYYMFFLHSKIALMSDLEANQKIRQTSFEEFFCYFSCITKI